MKKIILGSYITIGLAMAMASCSNPQVTTTQATNTAVPATAIPTLYTNPFDSIVASAIINQHEYPYLNHKGVFAQSIVALGDIDGDGPSVQAVAVTVGDDGIDPQSPTAASLYILFLNQDGTLLSHHRIDKNTVNAEGLLSNVENNIGNSIASLGDLDGAGASVVTIAIGDPMWHSAEGAIQLLYLLPDGSVLKSVTIDSSSANGPNDLHEDTLFGSSIAHIGNLDGVGGATTVLAVGAFYNDHPINAVEFDNPTGAVYLLYLLPDGSLLKTVKVGKGNVRFPADYPHPHDSFGSAVAWLPHIDHPNDVSKGVLAVGLDTRFDRNDPVEAKSLYSKGEVALIRLLPDGSVWTVKRINKKTPRIQEHLSSLGQGLVNIHPVLRDATHPGVVYGLGIAHYNYDQRRNLWMYLYLAEDLSILDSHNFNGETVYGFSDNIANSKFGVNSAYIGVLDPTKPYRHTFASHVMLADSTASLAYHEAQTLFLHTIDTRWDR